ncbi:MAG: hypothetical protein J4G12_06310 [Gemmatimonadetes bacterium]|nr:hypothetical protein [Gemmatimonadota bacterium]
MEIDLALLADAANLDRHGKLNLLGVFDRIATMSFPARHPRMVLILRFAAPISEAGRHRVNITLQGPDGEQIVRVDGKVQISPSGPAVGGVFRVPHILNLDGLVFHKPGLYAFAVDVDGEHHLSISLVVEGQQTQPVRA